MPKTASSDNYPPVKMLFQKVIEFNNSSVLVRQLQSDFLIRENMYLLQAE